MPSKVKFDPNNMGVLLSSERRASLDTHRLLSTLPMAFHHVVADIGCGPGYFTIPLGKYLFDGKVFAIDVQKEMLDATQEALDAINLTNVDVRKSTERKLPLEDQSLDGALAAFVLQEATSPVSLLKEAWRCLKKSGWLVILEWDKREMDEGPPVKQRIDIDEMRAMTEKIGFRLTAQRALNGKQYMMTMSK